MVVNQKSVLLRRIPKARQALNRRNNHNLEAWGERKAIAEWARDSRASVNEKTIQTRISRGWKAEDAISLVSYSRNPDG